MVGKLANEVNTSGSPTGSSAEDEKRGGLSRQGS